MAALEIEGDELVLRLSTNERFGSLRRGDVVTAQVREGKIVLTKTCERGMITP